MHCPSVLLYLILSCVISIYQKHTRGEGGRRLSVAVGHFGITDDVHMGVVVVVVVDRSVFSNFLHSGSGLPI